MTTMKTSAATTNKRRRGFFALGAKGGSSAGKSDLFRAEAAIGFDLAAMLFLIQPAGFSALAWLGLLAAFGFGRRLHDHLAQSLKHGRFICFLAALALAHQQDFVGCSQALAGDGAKAMPRGGGHSYKPGDAHVKLRLWWKAC